MNNHSNNKKNIIRFYKYYWPNCERWSGVYQTLGMHIGYYEKDTKNFIEASFKMNEYVGKLIDLSKNKPLKILDAGCGVGGTCFYLGKLYPNIKFTGITIIPEQVQIANNYLRKFNIKNVNFFLKDFTNTGFPDCHFDGVFALESIAHTNDKKNFVTETYRILKNSGKLVVIGQFQTNVYLNPFFKKIYLFVLKSGGVPNLVTVETFISYLREIGFNNIDITDMSKNIKRGLLREILISTPYFFICIFKKMFKPKKYNPLKDTDFLLSIPFISVLLALKKTSKYYSISAVKIKK